MNIYMEYEYGFTFFTETTTGYLSKWLRFLDELKPFEWLELNSIFDWDVVEKSWQFLDNRSYVQNMDKNALFNQFTFMHVYITEQKKIEEWNSINISCESRWIDIFKFFKEKSQGFQELSAIVEYGFTIPITNASAERVFSLVNKVWTDDKSNINMETLKRGLQLKFNSNLTCPQFYEYILSQPRALTKVRSNEKYSE